MERFRNLFARRFAELPRCSLFSVFYFSLYLENPFPDKGPVITVKLSEHTEVYTPPSMNTPQTQLVEMLFEMNYDTGHWRRLKRTRVVARQQAAGQAGQ